MPFLSYLETLVDATYVEYVWFLLNWFIVNPREFVLVALATPVLSGIVETHKNLRQVTINWKKKA